MIPARASVPPVAMTMEAVRSANMPGQRPVERAGQGGGETGEVAAERGRGGPQPGVELREQRVDEVADRARRPRPRSSTEMASCIARNAVPDTRDDGVEVLQRGDGDAEADRDPAEACPAAPGLPVRSARGTPRA